MAELGFRLAIFVSAVRCAANPTVLWSLASASLHKGDNFCEFLFAFMHNKIPSEKEMTLNGKNLLPLGANSFLLESTHFHK